MNHLRSIAVDPGASGGIAYRADYTLEPMGLSLPSTANEIRDTIISLNPQVLVIEQLPLTCGKDIPEARVSKLQYNYGLVTGIAYGLGLCVIPLTPTQWQAVHGLIRVNETQSQWKSRLRNHAKTLYPHGDWTLKTADALLLLLAFEKICPTQ